MHDATGNVTDDRSGNKIDDEVHFVFLFSFHVGFIRRHALADFIGCGLAGGAIFLLKQADADTELASGPIQVIIGGFAPPQLDDLASD